MTTSSARSESAGHALTATQALRIDRTACTGVGMCARLLPEAIDLDPWGYPIVHADAEVDPLEVRRAAHACPRRALHTVHAAAAPTT